jgi:hypothetical protein
MARRTFMGWLLLASLAVAVPGCDAWEGRPKQAATYKLPKDKRVLVLVDVLEGLSPPPTFAMNMADRIGTQLFSNKAVEKLVPQDQVLALQQKDPAKFRKMGTSDIAQETGADVVVRVYLTSLQTQKSVDGLVVWGDATAYVKVIDKNGTLLWPGQDTGAQVVAHVNEVEVAVRDVPRVLKDLGDQLVTHIGRIFYEWQPTFGEMNPRSR